MRILSIPLVSLLLVGSLVQAENAFFADPILLGVHRGGSKWRPEHTVETYKEVAQRWPHALLEMDVRLTKDGVVVLHHDAKVNRTTNGTGPIEELTLDEVRSFGCGL